MMCAFGLCIFQGDEVRSNKTKYERLRFIL